MLKESRTPFRRFFRAKADVPYLQKIYSVIVQKSYQFSVKDNKGPALTTILRSDKKKIFADKFIHHYISKSWLKLAFTKFQAKSRPIEFRDT